MIRVDNIIYVDEGFSKIKPNITSIDVLPSKNQVLYEYSTLVSKLKHC